MDGTVRLQGFIATPYNAVCCTHCDYDMGYNHVHVHSQIGTSADEVTCPECFTKQYRTAANRAPDSWFENNCSQGLSMADQADESDTDTYQILENVSGYRVYEFEFPIGFSWDDVDHHEFDWRRQQILIRWTDGSETRFDIGYGELEDLDETGEIRIQNWDGDEVC